MQGMPRGSQRYQRKILQQAQTVRGIQNITTMPKINFPREIVEDFKKEGFTAREIVKYGIVMPLALLALIAIAEVVSNL